jgi:hypothetical protein
MVLFTSQAPILAVGVPVLLLAVLFEMVGLKTRLNITVLSTVALLCLVVAIFVRDGSIDLSEILYAVGVALAVILALYALATARRGQQRMWFTGLLIVVIVTVAVAFGIWVVIAPQDAESAAVMSYALTFVPSLGALMYGLFAPDIPKLRGSM